MPSIDPETLQGNVQLDPRAPGEWIIQNVITEECVEEKYDTLL